MTDPKKLNELSEDEVDAFELLTDPDSDNVALLKATFDGIETACMVLVDEDNAEGQQIYPMAILLNEELHKKLTQLG